MVTCYLNITWTFSLRKHRFFFEHQVARLGRNVYTAKGELSFKTISNFWNLKGNWLFKSLPLSPNLTFEILKFSIYHLWIWRISDISYNTREPRIPLHSYIWKNFSEKWSRTTVLFKNYMICQPIKHGSFYDHQTASPQRNVCTKKGELTSKTFSNFWNFKGKTP